jgi:hypothetical protein
MRVRRAEEMRENLKRQIEVVAEFAAAGQETKILFAADRLADSEFHHSPSNCSRRTIRR